MVFVHNNMYMALGLRYFTLLTSYLSETKYVLTYCIIIEYTDMFEKDVLFILYLSEKCNL